VPSPSTRGNRQSRRGRDKDAKRLSTFLAGTGDLNDLGGGSSGISRVRELMVAGWAQVIYSTV